MKIKNEYETREAIPEAYRDLFTEVGGKWLLTMVEGMKSEADVGRLGAALAKEKDAHKATKASLKKFGAMDPVETASRLKGFEALQDALGDGSLDEDGVAALVTRLDRATELEANAQPNAEKMTAMIESKVRLATKPLDRTIKELTEAKTGLESQVGEYESAGRTRKIHDAVRAAATKMKIRPDAMDDVLMLGEHHLEVTEDGSVTARDGHAQITPGLDPEAWLGEMQPTRTYWWPESQGGGATGGAGGITDNPWTKGSWNLTNQGAYARQHGPEKAAAAAKAAGSSVGAGPPPA